VALGIINKLGLSADAVANGNEAIKSLETTPYDLVLMDVQMPEMDGYEASTMIRNPSSFVLNHQIPIIAMTANAMQGDRDKCIAAGMNDYIPKPVTPAVLAEAFEKWLPLDDNKAKQSSSSTGTKNDTLAIFDYDGLMDRVIGDEQLLRKVTGVFVNDIPGKITLLKEAIFARDSKNVTFHAHSMKGASGNIGANQLYRLAAEMENAGKTGNLTGMTRLLKEFEAQFEVAVKEIHKKIPPQTQEKGGKV
jgi:CheY-like chemotaxis protein/HPt (histidine-containing phosphotransfer) domain-containing protein